MISPSSLRQFRRPLAFAFPRVSDRWLTLLRCGLALELLFYCASVGIGWRGQFFEGGDGLLSRGMGEAVLAGESALVPRLGWVISVLQPIGVSESGTLRLLWLLLLCAAFLLGIGLFTRATAIVAWLLHLAAVQGATVMSYGMDNFTTIGLFYLALSPLPDALAWDAKLRGKPPKPPRIHGLVRRVLQIHLCIIYFFAGITKALGPAWWSGEAPWRALTRSPFNVVPPAFLKSYPMALMLIGIAVFLLELSYPIFIWPEATRRFWLAAIIAMHLGIAFSMGLYLFGLIMIVLNIAAFAPAAWSPAHASGKRLNTLDV